MISLFKHQAAGANWLFDREGAGLFWEMGTGKSRTALFAARGLFDRQGRRMIDRVLVLAPASVGFAWREELTKLGTAGFDYNLVKYKPETQKFVVEAVGGRLNGNPKSHLPVCIVSYGLVQQKRHKEALARWCASGKTVLICDESSFLKSRQAKQTKHTQEIAESCSYRWLLSGTPVANSPLDLFSQAEVMYPQRGRGPLAGFSTYYAFQAAFAELQLRRMGQVRFQEVVGYKNLDKLQKRFAPFVSRVEKKDCLDLPEKTYTVREVALTDETWKVYQELKRDCLITLPDSETRPEPNAAVKLLRLSQITSGHVGVEGGIMAPEDSQLKDVYAVNDTSSEKLDWLVEQLTSGELSQCGKVIVWCRWRRERERLRKLLCDANTFKDAIWVGELYGGQAQKDRALTLAWFNDLPRAILLAQQHAGGYGLNLQVASTAVFLSNDYSWSTRIQAEDRIHRSGQKSTCTYVDVLATGPKGQQTIDHVVLAALREKRDLATLTCSAWRKVLE